MGAGNRALFERCPLCHKGVVVIATRKGSAGVCYGIDACPACGAIFSPSGDGGFRLAFCNPRKLAATRGLTRPGAACLECTPFPGCLIDRTLAKTEWDALSSGQAMEPWVALREEGEGRVLLAPAVDDEGEASATGNSESDVIHLIEDDVVHHESTVRLGQAEFGDPWHDEAQLLLTSRRIIIVHQTIMFDIRLADIEKVEPSFPGFVITARSVRFPLYCLPTRGDLVYHAILGAWKRIH